MTRTRSATVREVLVLLALTLLAAACGGGEETAGELPGAPSAADEPTPAGEAEDDPTAPDPTATATAPDGDAEGELTTVRVATIPISDLGAYFYAIEEGIFADHGLNVENSSAAGGAAGIAAMTGGEVDLVYTNNVSVLLSASQGLPITIVCGANENVPTGDDDMAAFVVPSDVTAPQDLVGTTVATNALNNINWLYMRVLLRESGVDPDALEYVEVPFPEQAAGLLEGRIQGTLIPEPFKTQLLGEGANSLGFAYRAGEGNDNETTAIASFVATPQFAQENPETVQRFCEALGVAIAEIEQPDNRDAFLDAMAANTALERDQIEQITLATYTTDVPVDELEELGGYMVQEGLLEELPDLEPILSLP